jgi:hypothetical protein
MRHNEINGQYVPLSILQITFHTVAFDDAGVPDLLSSSVTVPCQYRTALVCPTAAFFLLQVWLFWQR